MEKMLTKQECYERATMLAMGDNPLGTRQDVIWLAMDLYAAQPTAADEGHLNYLRKAEFCVIEGIKHHKYFPEYMREEMIDIIASGFQTLSKTIAAIQLCELRIKQHPPPTLAEKDDQS